MNNVRFRTKHPQLPSTTLRAALVISQALKEKSHA